MSIHQQIKEARDRLGWSMERLAKEVSEAEGLAKPLTWQTVQQWENGTSAPKRTRMQIVSRLLGLDDGEPSQAGELLEPVTPAERAMLISFRQLLKEEREQFHEQIALAAHKRQREAAEWSERFGVDLPAEYRATPEDHETFAAQARKPPKARRSA